MLMTTAMCHSKDVRLKQGHGFCSGVVCSFVCSFVRLVRSFVCFFCSFGLFVCLPVNFVKDLSPLVKKITGLSVCLCKKTSGPSPDLLFSFFSVEWPISPGNSPGNIFAISFWSA